MSWILSFFRSPVKPAIIEDDNSVIVVSEEDRGPPGLIELTESELEAELAVEPEGKPEAEPAVEPESMPEQMNDPEIVCTDPYGKDQYKVRAEENLKKKKSKKSKNKFLRKSKHLGEAQ